MLFLLLLFFYQMLVAGLLKLDIELTGGFTGTGATGAMIAAGVVVAAGVYGANNELDIDILLEVDCCCAGAG
tara:strand:+ start:81 stop:296 length:216 start_codon:yes stop_codon:yes gene_type:complete